MKRVTVLTLSMLVIDRIAKAAVYYGLEPMDGFIIRGPVLIGFGNATSDYYTIAGYEKFLWILPLVWSISMIAVFVVMLTSDWPREAKVASATGIVAVISQLCDIMLYHVVVDYIFVAGVVCNIADVMLWVSGSVIAVIGLRYFIGLSRAERSIQNARP